MKICLVNTNVNPGIEDFLRAEIQMGLIYLASSLEQKGHIVEIVDLNLLIMKEGWQIDGRLFKKMANRIAGTRSDLVGINTRSDTFPASINIARATKQVLPGIPVVMGGFKVTTLARETLETFPFIDFILRGEAEYSLCELAYSLENDIPLENVSGLTYRKNGRVIENPDAETFPDLDKIPMPAYQHYEQQLTGWTKFQQRQIFINTGRGCPLYCEFCVCPEIYKGKYRLRSPDSIIAEIRFLNEKYGVYRFSMGLDHFLIKRDHVENLCYKILDAGLDINWNCCALPQYIDEELLVLMKKSGLSSLSIGIESGSSKIQKKIRKNMPLGKISSLLQLCDKYDLFVMAFFILGFPGETIKDINKTLKLVIEYSTYFKVFTLIDIFAPMSGSGLYRKVREKLAWTGLFSNVAEGITSHIPANLRLIKKYPTLFSEFYNVPIDNIKPATLYELAQFYHKAVLLFPLTMKIAFDELKIEPVEFFLLIRRWAKNRGIFKTKLFIPSLPDILKIMPEFLKEKYKKDKVSPVFMKLVLKREIATSFNKTRYADQFIKTLGEDLGPVIMKELFSHKIAGM
ncbi:MAG: radical SAM protein [Candidatus Eremiobacteraeota bacterium]|nr:radical SAM protein [Candidatus Eremiobacteraeota bacterium]